MIIQVWFQDLFIIVSSVRDLLAGFETHRTLFLTFLGELVYL